MKQIFFAAILSIWCIAQPSYGALAPSKSEAKEEWSLKSCLDNPVKTVDESCLIVNKVNAIKTQKTDPVSIEKMKEIIIETASKGSPISMLVECGTKECLLSRKENPRGRVVYELGVIQALLKKLTEKDAVIYTSFASGGLFQDFIIIAKTLAQRPTAKITIHFIDIYFGIFLEGLKKLGRPLKIDDNISDSSTILPNLIRESLPKVNSKDAGSYICSTFFSTELRLLQFTRTLRKLFPKASIDVFIHRSAREYAESIELPANAPDVLTAADICDNFSTKTKARNDFFNLCRLANKYSIDPLCIYLDCIKCLQKQYVYLLTKKNAAF